MSKTKDKKKLLVKRQRNVGTTKMQKEKRGRRINKELLELEAKYDALKDSHTKLKIELKASNNRLKTVFPLLSEDYRKSVEVQTRFNEQQLEEAEKIK